MTRTRGLTQLAFLAVCSAVISCASDVTSADIQSVVDHIVVTLGLSTLSVGQTVQAGAIAQTASGGAIANVPLTWSTSNAAIAAVTSAGLVTAVAPGNAIITAAAEGKSASATITVASMPVSSVAVILSDSSAKIGQTVSATATIRDANNNMLPGRPIAWASSNTAVASVDAQGAITAVAPGTATIVATSEGISGAAPLSVQSPGVPIASIDVSLGMFTLPPTATTQATATLHDATGAVLTGRAITWSSSDITVATISASGIITGVTAGTATITATSEGVTGSAMLTVRPLVATVAVSLGSFSLSVTNTTAATAVVRDATGTVLTDRVVTWTSGNTSIATVTPAGLVTALATGTTIITGTADGIPGSATLNVRVPASSVAVTLGTVSLGVGLTTYASAMVRDATGALLTGRTITWSSSNPSVATVAADGTVTGVALGTADISGRVDNATGTATVTVSVTGGGSTNSGTQLAVVTQPGGAVSGLSLGTAPVIEIRDAAGVRVPNASNIVFASVASGTGALAGGTAVAVNGIATFTNLRIDGSGPHTLTFSSTGLTSATSSSFTVGQAPGGLSIETQPGGAVTGSVLAIQPVVRILDNAGLLIASSTLPVTATIASGNGTISGTTTVNAVNGVATFTNLRVTGTGSVALAFSIASPALQVVSAAFPLASAAATKLAIVTQPAGAVSGVTFTTQPVVQIRDASNVLVPGANAAVTVSLASGNGSLLGTTTVNTVNGTATFTDLRISGSGSQTLVFSAAGLTSATSSAFTVTQTAGSIQMLTQPAGATNGSPFTTQPSVRLLDVVGQPLTSFTGQVQVSIASGTGTLAGSVIVNAVAGVATFTNLSITGTGTFTLRFSAEGLGFSVVSAPFTIAAGSGTATKLAVTAQPAGAVTGAIFGTQPVIQIRDASNALVNSTAQVTASLNGSGGTLSGTTTVSAVAGVATFTNLKITGTGAFTITFSSTGLTSATSSSLTVASSGGQTATQLAITIQPSTTVASGSAFTQQPSVQLRDASNQPVSLSGFTVTATIASGTGTLGGTTTATTNASGVATFSNLSISSSATASFTLAFNATGLASATSGAISVTVTPPPPPPPGGFATPNILNNASFENTWNGFTDWAAGTPNGTGLGLDNSLAYNGSWSVRRTWSPNPGGDVGAQMAYQLGSTDHIWIRFYFKLTAPITSIMKFMRFYAPGFGTAMGGIFMGSGSDIFTFGGDLENSAITTSIGLTQAQVIDGNWHSLEVEYWRNGDPSGWPSAAFWFDGNVQALPNGAYVQYDCRTAAPGATCSKAYWSGGRLYSGVRATSSPLGVMEWLATLNAGNTTTGQINLDRIAISTAGRIGP